MKRILLLSILVAAALKLVGCGCPVLEPADLTDRRVREATVTTFNPTWDFVKDQSTPEYSIHTFRFPNTISSSGDLPNDERVGSGRQTLLSTESFKTPTTGDTVFTALLQSSVPPNADLEGDIMVVSVDVTVFPFKARLRFYGALSKFSDSLASGSASEFTEFLEDRESQFSSLAGSATSGGFHLSSPGSIAGTITVLDPAGKDVTSRIADPINPITIPVDVQQRLEQRGQATEVVVDVGDVYYYRARNGIEFGVLIEDIFRGSLAPNLRRMTIKFAELRSVQQCDV